MGTDQLAVGGGASLTVKEDGSTILEEASILDMQTLIQATKISQEEVEVGYEIQNLSIGQDGGSIASGEVGIVSEDGLGDGEGIDIYKCGLTTTDGGAVASGVNMVVATLPGDGTYTQQGVLISGDGSTVFNEITGSPVVGYTNSSGSEQTVAVLVENKTGGPIDIFGYSNGVIV